MYSQIFILSYDLFSAILSVRLHDFSFSHSDSHILVAFVEKPHTVKCSSYPLRQGQQCSHPEPGLLHTVKKRWHGNIMEIMLKNHAYSLYAWFEHGFEASNTLAR
jgi:hypothetical protein